MEKYAFEIVEDVMEKYAKSYDAKRKKQYWQMMKKIHGGNDEAVQALTAKFGPGERTRHIDNAIIKPNVLAYEKPRGFENQYTTFSGANYSGPTVDGKRTRLKTPSELWGSKTLYPKTSKFSKSTNLNMNPRSMDKVTRDIKYRGADKGWNKYVNDNGLKGKELSKEDEKIRDIVRAGKKGEAFPNPIDEFDQDKMIISKKIDIPEELTENYNHKEVVNKLYANGGNKGKFKNLEQYISEQKQKQKAIPLDEVKPVNKKSTQKKKEQEYKGSTKAGAGLGLLGLGAAAKKTLQGSKSAPVLTNKKLRDRAMPALAGLGAAGTAYGYGTDKAAFEIVDNILSK